MDGRRPNTQEKGSCLRRLAARTPTSLSVIASLIAIGGAGFGLYKALASGDDSAPASSEAKQVISFHQLANRICTENQQALERALPEARSRVQLLAFLSRGTGWGVNDLEGVTAPASLASPFGKEISLRQSIEEALLEVQRAGETGELASQAEAMQAVASAEETAAEVDHELGLRQCAPILPSKVRRAINVA